MNTLNKESTDEMEMTEVTLLLTLNYDWRNAMTDSTLWLTVRFNDA